MRRSRSIARRVRQIAAADRRAGRGVSQREDLLVSESLRRKAHVLPNGEVCWGGDDIEAALHEIADAGQVILGFEILEPLREGKLKVWGWSGFKMDGFLQSAPWSKCVRLALDAAIKEVRDTGRFGLEPPFSDLWYLVTSANQLGEAKLRKLPSKSSVRRPEPGPGSSE
jgi:hypothetical protein